MKFAEKIKSFVKPRLTRLLFLATLLVVFNAGRLAALAKYNAYLSDYTSAVAGDFFFRSNYLFEPEERAENYQITNWDGKEFNIELSIFNFENAYRYNQAGTDFLYTVRVEAFTDPQCTQRDGLFHTLKVEYKDRVAATCIDNVPGSTPGSYVSERVDCAMLRGMSSYSKDAGSSVVYVKTEREELKNVNQSRYIKVTAHTIPIEWMEEEGRVVYSDGVEPITTKEGIYYGEISAVFQLTRPSGTSDVIANYIPGTDNSRTLRLMCKSSDTGSAEVRVYYNKDKLQPTEDMGTYSTEKRPQSETDFDGWRYVTVKVKLGASADVTFNRIDPNKEIYYDPSRTGRDRRLNDLGFDVYVAQGGGEEVQYNVTKETSVNGKVVSIKAVGESGELENISKAPEGRVIYITTEANENYEKDGLKLHHSDDVGNIIVSESGGVYSFKMPADAVGIEGLFKEKEIPPATESEPERETEPETEPATDSNS